MSDSESKQSLASEEPMQGVSLLLYRLVKQIINQVRLEEDRKVADALDRVKRIRTQAEENVRSAKEIFLAPWAMMDYAAKLTPEQLIPNYKERLATNDPTLHSDINKARNKRRAACKPSDADLIKLVAGLHSRGYLTKEEAENYYRQLAVSNPSTETQVAMKDEAM